MRPVCRHCGGRLRTRPRGLCFACYNTPAVRDLYPCGGGDRRGLRRGVGENVDNPRTPVPTNHAPGTPEKQLVLAERAKAGEFLFHPLDRRVED